jgi:hypothetical protein
MAARAKCFPKAIKKGEGVSNACLLDATYGIVSKSWPKAEKKDDCVHTGEENQVSADVGGFFDEDYVCSPGPYNWPCTGFTRSKCDAKKIKSQGKIAKKLATSIAKSVKKNELWDSNIVSSLLVKAVADFEKADKGDDCTLPFDGIDQDLVSQFAVVTAVLYALGSSVRICCRQNAGVCRNYTQFEDDAYSIDCPNDFSGTVVEDETCHTGGQCLPRNKLTNPECEPPTACIGVF